MSTSPAEQRETLPSGPESGRPGMQDPEPEVFEADVVQPDPTEAVTAPEAADAAPVPAQPEPEPSSLDLEAVEPTAPAAPDLAAVDAPVSRPGQGTNLDLPSLQLPHPAPEPAPPAPPAPTAPSGTGQDYAQNLAQSTYGQPSPQPVRVPSQATPPPYAEPPYANPGYSQPSFGQQRYSEPAPAQPAYGQLAPYTQLSPTDENTWAAAAHWSAILASFVGLGFLGPLLVLLIQGPKSARVRANAVESLNFEITFVIAMVISIILIGLLIGLITTPILGLVWLILRIIASVQTSSGQDYRYPFALRLVK